MKILLITRYYPPLQGIATERMASWVKYFRRLGHETVVLTTGKKGSSSDEGVIEVPYFDPVDFLCGERVKQRSPKIARFYRNRLNERMPGRTDPWIFPAIKRIKHLSGFDLILSSYGPPSAHIAGYFAKKHLGCLWFADFRDLWVDNHNYIGLPPFTLLERFWEKKICRKADALLTVSEGLKGALKEKYPAKSVYVIPNGFDPEDYGDAASDYFKGFPRKFRMVYTGTLYEGKHNIDPLFQALSDLKGSDFPNRFELLFYGTSSHYLAEKIAQYRLEGIVFYRGFVSSKEIKSVQKSADAFLQIHFDFDRYDGLVSGKIYEYLYAGKPILGVGIPPNCELGRIIVDSGRGILCQTREEIKTALPALLEGLVIQKNRQSFTDRFSRRRHAEEIIAVAREFSQRMISSS